MVLSGFEWKNEPSYHFKQSEIQEISMPNSRGQQTSFLTMNQLSGGQKTVVATGIAE